MVMPHRPNRLRPGAGDRRGAATWYPVRRPAASVGAAFPQCRWLPASPGAGGAAGCVRPGPGDQG